MAFTAPTNACIPVDIETLDQRASQSRNSKSYAISSAFVLGIMVATIGLHAMQRCALDAGFTKFLFLPAMPKKQSVSTATGTSVGAQVGLQAPGMSLRVVQPMMQEAEASPLVMGEPRRGTATRHFINLSNGAEAIKLLANAGVPPEAISFMRIQSSHCEAADYNGILQNLDHNLLMHLALGYECRVYDFGSRGNMWVKDNTSDADADDVPRTVFKYVPRALWWGLEWSRYALTRLWKLDVVDATPLLRGVNVEPLFSSKLRELPKPLRKKLTYYREYVVPGLSELKLKGYFTGTLLDGEKEAYRDMLFAHANRSIVVEAKREPPPAPEEFEDMPLELYDAWTFRKHNRTRRIRRQQKNE